MNTQTTTATEAPVRRLERPRDGRVIAGVAEGLGRYFDIDPVLVRIAFAVSALAGGAGLLVYGIAWLAVPDEGAERPAVGRDGRTWPLVVLGAIGVLTLLDLAYYATLGI